MWSTLGFELAGFAWTSMERLALKWRLGGTYSIRTGKKAEI
jgi:hypothetical protein